MPTPSKPPTIYIGIDPGVNGGISAIWPSGEVVVAPMPAEERAIYDHFYNLAAHRFLCQARIEKIETAFGGTTNVSKLYGSYRALRMALVACGIPFEAVRPQDWQAALKIPKKTEEEKVKQMLWKERLCRKAKRLFPKLLVWKSGVGKQRQVADSLLIAFYCRMQHNGGTKDRTRGTGAGSKRA